MLEFANEAGDFESHCSARFTPFAARCVPGSVSVRVAFFLLLLANLAFFVWATFIDVPPAPPQSDSISRLPQLELASEAHARIPQQTNSQARPLAQTAPGTANAPAITTGSTPSSSGASAGSAASATSAPGAGTSAAPAGAQQASTSSASAPAIGQGASAAASAPGAGPSGAQSVPLAAAQNRCVTIGPFSDHDQTAQAIELLEDRGFVPRERAEQSTTADYWVFVGALTTQAQEDTVLKRLQRNGIADARPMPTAQHKRRISVGLFNGESGAEQRAQAVRALGFDARIEARKRTAPAQWLDVDLGASTQSLPTEGLLSLEGSERLEMKPCSSVAGAQASASAGGSDSKALAAAGTASSR